MRVSLLPDDDDLDGLVPEAMDAVLRALGCRFLGTKRTHDPHAPVDLAPHAIMRPAMAALAAGTWREAVYATDDVQVTVEAFDDGPCLTLTSLLDDGALVRVTSASEAVLTALGGSTSSWPEQRSGKLRSVPCGTGASRALPLHFAGRPVRASLDGTFGSRSCTGWRSSPERSEAAVYRSTVVDGAADVAWAEHQALLAGVQAERGAPAVRLEGLDDAVRLEKRMNEVNGARPLADVWVGSVPETLPLRRAWQALLWVAMRCIDLLSGTAGDRPPPVRTLAGMREAWPSPPDGVWEL